MSTYIRSLNEGMEREHQAREAAAEAKRSAKAKAARERLTPLDDRLRRLLATIPVEAQGGISLPALQGMLKGRQGGYCHPGELGAALRRLGWRDRRRWGSRASGEGYTRRWYPPARA